MVFEKYFPDVVSRGCVTVCVLVADAMFVGGSVTVGVQVLGGAILFWRALGALTSNAFGGDALDALGADLVASVVAVARAIRGGVNRTREGINRGW